MNFIVHDIWDVNLPIDELHHFSRWESCTTNQKYLPLLTIEFTIINIINGSHGQVFAPAAPSYEARLREPFTVGPSFGPPQSIGKRMN
jgi:hypothetical protein